MNKFIEDILDVLFSVEPQYRRRNIPQYDNPARRPPLSPGETGGYLWDGKHWVYDVQATPEDLQRYRP